MPSVPTPVSNFKRLLFKVPDILLVEEKDSLRRVLRLTLENAVYKVTESTDSRAAVNEASFAPKSVLTDLRMSNEFGLNVLLRDYDL